MRLATWNCSRGSGDAAVRAAEVADLAPDITVLQECAVPGTAARHVVWLGGKVDHGVAVVVLSPFTAFRLDDQAVDESAYRCRIEGPRSFNLLAVWAKKPRYVSSIYSCLDRHRDWLLDGPTVIAGDFNSHARWDRNGRPNHTDLVTRLRDEFGLVSAWHSFPGNQGKEEPATLFHLWKAERPYHIDYIFIPEWWVSAVTRCWIPDDPAGARRSDHRPVVVELEYGGVEPQ